MILPKTFFSGRKYFGLVFSKSSLRGLSLNQEGKIESYAQVGLAENVIDGKLDQPEQLVESLKKLKAQGKFSSFYAAVVIPESHAFSREYTMPAVSTNEIGEAISWQLKNIFPFSPEEIYSDWKLIKSDEKNVTVLVVAVQKVFLNGLREVLEKVGIYPISIEPSASAVSRLLSFDKKPIIGLVEVDSRGSTATLVEKGISLLTTTSQLSKKVPNLSVTTVESINSLLKYYSEKKKVSTENIQFYLTGERADKNLAQILTDYLKRKIVVLSIDSIAPPFHQAYAAAMTRIFSPKSEKSINLIPTSLHELYELEHTYSVLKITLKVVISMFILFLIFSASNLGLLMYKVYGLDIQKTQLEEQSQLIKSNLPVGEILKSSGRIKTLFSLKEIPYEELVSVFSLIPTDVKLESLSYSTNKKKFQLYGVAKDRSDLLDYKESLEEANFFSDIHLPLGAFESGGDISFSLDFTIKADKAK